MIRINLLPFRAARKKENIRRQVSISLLSMALILIVLVYVSFLFISKVGDLKKREAAAKVELASLEKVEKEIKAMEKAIRDIEQKLGVIKELEKRKTGPVHLLDEIATAIPKDKVWLTSLSESKGFISLKGVAMDNETVALFMNNLDKSGYLDTIELGSTKIRDIPQYNLKVSDFTLTCKITPLK